MSQNTLRLIPTDPGWLPTAGQEAAAVALLKMLAPGCGAVTSTTAQAIVFVDAGANFQAIFCPLCGHQMEWAWWQEQMDVAWKTDFTDLTLTTPCCDSPSTLNDLRYDWPQGFSRWRLEVESPDRMGLTIDETAMIGAVLGHDVREIWSHI